MIKLTDILLEALKLRTPFIIPKNNVFIGTVSLDGDIFGTLTGDPNWTHELSIKDGDIPPYLEKEGGVGFRVDDKKIYWWNDVTPLQHDEVEYFFPNRKETKLIEKGPLNKDYKRAHLYHVSP